ncbi:uncharacterized protein C1orf112-like [Argonauta hians]
MSQMKFLEEVKNWKSDRCSQELDSALPRLISCLTSSDLSLDTKVGVFNVICLSFLPHLNIVVIETKLFCQISTKTTDLLGEILRKAEKVPQKSTENSTEFHQEICGLLQLALNVVDCTESCVRHVCSSSDQVDMEYVHTLLASVFNVLTQSYEHCKASPTLYGETLPFLSDVLSAFFKKTHQLQTSTLRCLEKLHVKSTEQDVVDLCSVCHNLFSLCQLVPALDIKIMIGLWKALARLSVQYKGFLYPRLELETILSFLTSSIQSNFDTLLNLATPLDGSQESSQSNEKLFQLTLKIAGFLMKVTVNLVKEYEIYLGHSVAPLYHLLLHLFKYSPPCLSAPPLSPHHRQDIQLQLLNASQPLLTSLITSRNFRLLLLLPLTEEEGEEGDEEPQPDDALPSLLVQMMVINLLPKAKSDVSDQWYSPGKIPYERCHDNILASVFKTMEKCSLEMSSEVSQPITAAAGSPQRNASLYEFLATNLCGFVGSWPLQHFSVLESVLLTAVLSTNPHTSLMACDVWCFIGRYGSASLCHHHVKVLALVWSALEWPQAQFYEQLLKLFHRLFKFQLIEDQEEVVKLFPPSQHLSLWSGVQLESLQERVSSPIKRELLQVCAKTIHTVCSSGVFSDSDMKSCLDVLRCLHSVSPYLVSLSKTGSTVHYLVLQRLGLLWSAADPSLLTSTSPHRSLVLSNLLTTSTHLLPLMKPSQLCSSVDFLWKLFESRPDELLRSSCCLFLKHIGRADLQDPQLCSKICTLFPAMFQHLLSDCNAVLHQLAMEAFATFAQLTNCESLVPQCLLVPTDSTKQRLLQDTAVTFLNHVSYHGDTFNSTNFLSSQRILINKDKAAAAAVAVPQMETNDVIPEETPEQHLEPLKKKLKTNSSNSNNNSSSSNNNNSSSSNNNNSSNSNNNSSSSSNNNNSSSNNNNNHSSNNNSSNNTNNNSSITTTSSSNSSNTSSNNSNNSNSSSSSSLDEEYQAILDCLHSNVNKLRSLRQRVTTTTTTAATSPPPPPPPAWVTTQLTAICRELSGLQ